jgi:pyruvate dehydrogenase E1 component alpha subunit
MEIGRETLLGLYRVMATIRAFEERFAAENAAGKPIGGGHSSAGQEAVAFAEASPFPEPDELTQDVYMDYLDEPVMTVPQPYQ